MAQKVGSLIISLALESGAFKSGLDASQKELARATRSMQAVGERMAGLGERLSIAVSAPLAAFGAMSVKVASDAAELQSAFNQTFGSMAKSMNAWAEATGDSMGRSTQEMQKAANTFGMFFNQAAPTADAAAKMSQTFAVLAQDLASFYNVDVQTAIDKLRSGLSGESEPLRDFGVFLNEAAVKAKALEMGLADAGGEISEQAKIMARYQLIMEATTKAQGDVARTSDSLANRARASRAALEELQVSVGQKLEPVMKLLLDVADRVLGAFNSLPSGAQTFIVALGGIAVVAGPVLIGLGAIVSALAPLSGALTLAAAGGFGAMGATLIALGSAIVAALPLIAAIAAGAALIYANWDQLVALFNDARQRITELLGPQVQAMIADVSAAMSEFFSGPLGTEIVEALRWVGRLSIEFTRFFGEALIRAISAALEFIRGFFSFVSNAFAAIGALLRGDFTGAWESAKAAILGAMTGLVNGLSVILTGKLDTIWKWVTDKIEVVRQAFFNLYDAVVGHSYIPDMVDGIAEQMARLQTVMVDPAERATKKAGDAFKAMAAEVQPILDRLFPEARALADYRRDLVAINRAEGGGVLDAAQAEEARRRLRGLTPGPLDVSAGGDLADTLRDMGKIEAELARISGAANDNAAQVQVANVRIAKSFKDMAQETVSALQGLANAIKGGGFLDVLGGVVNLLTQLGSIGLFGKKVQANINKPVPGYASGTAYHPGGLAVVGERGPELVNLPRGASVTPNHALRGAGGGMRVEVVPSPYFDVRVQHNIASAAPAIAQAGAQAGEARVLHRARRRVA